MSHLFERPSPSAPWGSYLKLLGAGAAFVTFGSISQNIGAVLAGALALALPALNEVGQTLLRATRGSEQEPSVEVILRAMVTMADANRSATSRASGLSDAQVNTIRVLCLALCGRAVARERVEDCLATRRAGLALDSAPPVSQQSAELAIKGAAMVALSRGGMQEAEQQTVLELAAALRVPRQRVAVCLHEALRTAIALRRRALDLSRVRLKGARRNR